MSVIGKVAIEIVEDDSGWTWELEVGDRRWNGLVESYDRAREQVEKRLPKRVAGGEDR